MKSSNSFSWWPMLLAKSFNPFCAEAQILQIWPNKSFSCPIFPTTEFFETKIHWEVCPITTNNSRESGKVLTNLMCFLKSFFRLPFSRWNLQTWGFFFLKKVLIYYVPIFMWSKDVCFAHSFWHFSKRVEWRSPWLSTYRTPRQ